MPPIRSATRRAVVGPAVVTSDQLKRPQSHGRRGRNLHLGDGRQEAARVARLLIIDEVSTLGVEWARDVIVEARKRGAVVIELATTNSSRSVP